jgi:ATP-dependent RNA helicase SUPV3L1/SUV3
MQLSFQEQLQELLHCDLKETFPTARSMNRKLYFFVGPTNSGKTYSAMQELMKADCGIYLAPLRLLALENYETLKEKKINSALITGEEEIFEEDSTHICSTIEMLNFELQSDICIIDEIQMLEDFDRGWAWVNAIIGAPASKVIMTGSVNALDSVKKIAHYLGEELEIVKFQRKTPLDFTPEAIPFRDITPGTALIAFSRKEVLRIKSKLSKFFKVSVLYGNLSPEVRRDEAKRFRDGETQILVATDAIAMGLNLPIKTLLFTTDNKFDGIEQRTLFPHEVTQIAGRAGRYGHFEAGHIGGVKPSVHNSIKEVFETPMHTIKPPFYVKATIEQIETFAAHLGTKELTKILSFYTKNMRYSGPFKATNISNMLELSRIVDRQKLTLEEKFILAGAPINTKSPLLKDAFYVYIKAIVKKEKCAFKLMTRLSKLATTELELLRAEDEIKKISLYLWLSYKMPEIFFDTQKAYRLRTELNKYCENSLKTNQISQTKLKKQRENRRQNNNKKYYDNQKKNNPNYNRRRKKHNMKKER